MADSPTGGRFRQTEYQSHPEHFGNAFVVFTGEDVKLRFARDRDEVEVDVGNVSSNKWWLLEIVAEAVGEAPVGTEKVAHGPTLKQLLPVIVEHFSDANYHEFEKQLQAAAEKRKQELLNRWSKKDR